MNQPGGSYNAADTVVRPVNGALSFSSAAIFNAREIISPIRN